MGESMPIALRGGPMGLTGAVGRVVSYIIIGGGGGGEVVYCVACA